MTKSFNYKNQSNESDNDSIEVKQTNYHHNLKKHNIFCCFFHKKRNHDQVHQMNTPTPLEDERQPHVFGQQIVGRGTH